MRPEMSDGSARLRVMSVQIPGFDYQTVRVNELAINVATHGEGPALLLHGFPQTHLAWRGVARHCLDDSTLCAQIRPATGPATNQPDIPAPSSTPNAPPPTGWSR